MSIIVVTTEQIHGKKISKTLGMVRGNTVRARNIGRDILALFRNIAGGEVHEYTKLLAESREQALDRMVEEAQSLGANAIVNVRFATSMVAQGTAELLAYGTAVVVEDV
ncbi:MAG: YbjQ family protein [Psychrosphaera sp.]|nr:YbjQ family protein [Psychrosphaera sp.]